jgi:hypothetical protein
MYSSLNDRGHFGVSKIIFGDTGIYNPVIDIDGIYGMTQHSMAIKINNNIHGCNVLISNTFQEILNSCLYSSYAIDWNIFKNFRKDFWKEII